MNKLQIKQVRRQLHQGTHLGEGSIWAVSPAWRPLAIYGDEKEIGSSLCWVTETPLLITGKEMGMEPQSTSAAG